MAHKFLTDGMVNAFNDDLVGAGAPLGSTMDNRENSVDIFAGISPSAVWTPSPQDSHWRAAAAATTTTAVVAAEKDRLPSNMLEAASQLTPRRLRKSCDFCTKRKRKCDGNGVNRCSLCVEKQQPVCHYSVCLQTGPKPQSVSTIINSSHSSRSPVNITPRASGASEDDCRPGAYFEGRGQSSPECEITDSVAGSAAGAQRSHSLHTAAGPPSGGANAKTDRGAIGDPRYAPLMVLKRARLSPSPATGLVGLKENVYIADFFQTLGFFPFTDESTIRTALIATAFGTRNLQEDYISDDSEWIKSTRERVDDRGERSWGRGRGAIRLRMSSAEVAAAACVLWCTVAVGYLVQGRPVELVEEYVNLASEALTNCFDDAGEGTTRALISMALVHNYLGNEVASGQYLDSAESSAAGLPLQATSKDLKRIIVQLRACELFWMDPALQRRKYSELRQEDFDRRQKSLQLSAKYKTPNILRKSDLHSWLSKTFFRLGYSFYQDLWNGGLYDRSHGGNEKGLMEGGERGGCTAPDVSLGDNPPFSASSVEQVLQETECLTEDPVASLKISRNFAAMAMREFAAVESSVVIADMRDGVGELFFRAMRAWASALEGHDDDSLRDLMRCGDIVIQHPGFCRTSTWRHIMHVVLGTLAEKGFEDKYSEIRKAYNSVMSRSWTPKAPPFEEWSGITEICNNAFCRSFVSIETSRKSGRSNEDRILACLQPKESIEDTRNDDEWDGGKEGQRTVSVDSDSWSERKKNDPDGEDGLVFPEVSIVTAEKDLNVAGGESRREQDKVVSYPVRFGGSPDVDEKDATIIDWSCRSHADRNEKMPRGERGASDCFGRGEIDTGGRNGDASMTIGGSSLSCFHSEELMPLPLTIEGEDVLEGSDSSSVMEAFVGLLTEVD